MGHSFTAHIVLSLLDLVDAQHLLAAAAPSVSTSSHRSSGSATSSIAAASTSTSGNMSTASVLCKWQPQIAAVGCSPVTTLQGCSWGHSSTAASLLGLLNLVDAQHLITAAPSLASAGNRQPSSSATSSNVLRGEPGTTLVGVLSGAKGGHKCSIIIRTNVKAMTEGVDINVILANAERLDSRR